MHMFFFNNTLHDMKEIPVQKFVYQVDYFCCQQQCCLAIRTVSLLLPVLCYLPLIVALQQYHNVCCNK
jgi:hypothetical protein